MTQVLILPEVKNRRKGCNPSNDTPFSLSKTKSISYNQNIQESSDNWQRLGDLTHNIVERVAMPEQAALFRTKSFVVVDWLRLNVKGLENLKQGLIVLYNRDQLTAQQVQILIEVFSLTEA
jgi:hypothetical protein